MKTFEKEKGNIPDGATHYREETNRDSFAWVCFYPTPKLTIDGVSISGVDLAVSGENLNNLKPIPQTNIETPEEKEVLDSINSNLIKPRELSQPRFSKCETVFSFSHGERRFILRGIDTDHPQLEVVRHETEAERVERERDEFKVEICKDLEIEAVGCNTACIINKLYELGYRKGSE